MWGVGCGVKGGGWETEVSRTIPLLSKLETGSDVVAVLRGCTQLPSANFGRSQLRYTPYALCFFQEKQITVCFIGK